MITITVTSTHNLTSYMLFDPLITAYEGGIGYWAHLDIVKLGSFNSTGLPDDEHPYAHAWAPLSDGGYVVLSDSTDECAFSPVLVNRDVLAKGLQRVANVEPQLFTRLIDGDIDAEDADRIMQHVCFGDVLFG